MFIGAFDLSALVGRWRQRLAVVSWACMEITGSATDEEGYSADGDKDASDDQEGKQ